MRVDDIPLVSGANLLGHIEEIRSDRFGFFRRDAAAFFALCDVFDLAVLFGRIAVLAHGAVVPTTRAAYVRLESVGTRRSSGSSSSAMW